jgi:DNA-binding XRE family transcriptional regulator
MVTRIRQLLEHKQLTPTQFADLIGVGRPVMSHILSERNKPSLEVAQRIGSAFPDISLAWLMFGTSEMLAVETASPSAGPTSASEQPAPEPTSESPQSASPPAEADTVPLATPAEASEPGAPALFATTPPPPIAPSVPLVALPRPFSATLPPSAPLPAPAPAPVGAPVAPPMPAPLAETVPGGVPVVPRPFRPARVVPATQAAPKPAPAGTEPSVAPVASPVIGEAQPTALPAPFQMPATTAATLPASLSPEAAMLPFLAESGKAIRRIVIFYRDGSFADYQPE